MKKLFCLLVVFLLTTTVVIAADMYVPAAALPQPAQEFITKHYSNAKPLYVEKDFDGYEVRLENGAKIDFRNDGEWEQISDYSGVPANLLPANVLASAKQAQPQAAMIEIEKEWFGEYKIKFSNRIKMKIASDGRIFYQKFD